MIGVIDYGIGNIGSIGNMLKKIGAVSKPIDCPEKIKPCNKVILPGVGKFDYGMERLAQKGFHEAIRAFADEGKPILGICLGMQLLLQGSAEGMRRGLSLANGNLERFSFEGKKYPVPHMGWNDVHFEGSLLGSGIESFYFVHSFYLPIENRNLSGYTHYGGLKFTSSIESDNIFGVQFHPEKSHKYGMKILKNFSELNI